MICRELTRLGIRCLVITPSLIPRKPGERKKKTDTGGTGAVPSASPEKVIRLPLWLLRPGPDIEKRRRQRVALRGGGNPHFRPQRMRVPIVDRRDSSGARIEAARPVRISEARFERSENRADKAGPPPREGHPSAPPQSASTGLPRGRGQLDDHL